MSAVKGLKRLTCLKLFNNKISDIKPLMNLTQLTQLHLDINRITEITPLKNLTQLIWLSLRHNSELTKAQIEELQEALPECKIWH